MSSRSLLFFSAFLLMAFPLPGFANDAPAWLQQAAALKPPVYQKDVPAVVLHNDRTVTVANDGRLTTVTNYAVRILTREGRDHAVAREIYLTNSGKVRELQAWLVRANGSVKKFGKNEVVDLIADANDIYNEYRLKIVDASDLADAGTVFGYQAISEEKPLFFQDTWDFQRRLPTLVSSYRLNLPNGWRASSVTFNHPNVEPTVSGSTYHWALRDLKPIPPEPASPLVRNLAPRLAVTYFLPDAGASTNARTFESWLQVSRWGTELHDAQAVPNEAIVAKARELTANAKSELDRIKAIGQFVQSLQYISIDIGIGKGNGYRPHAAAQVLAKAYGDCKDKANLMRALLKTLDITAYPVFIYSGDPTLVREEWASPTQFNHCIIAIKISDETKVPTVIEHATLGRLLIFDATDEHTPVGDLPDDAQGSLALIVAGDAGALMRMPVLPPELSHLERHADVVLTPDGSITASLTEKSVGQAAVNERRAFRQLSSSEYNTMIERWITRGASAAKVSRVIPVDDNLSGRFGLEVDFSAAAYAQVMQGRLLVFNPAIVSRREFLFLTEPTRAHPVVLGSNAFSETVRVKLPAGFEVDELPDALELKTSFGSYTTKYEVANGELVYTRSLAQQAGTVPAQQYEAVRNFYSRIRAAEQAPVVLLRK
ncbi:MAG TPA: DUF3857 domain-containing transglutaminase family protein [Pyrinomonadaceae bacterium]|nr:DUF3857 domain-containing transglutaminase family protein [Pyrinomonadaceae bacterium]